MTSKKHGQKSKPQKSSYTKSSKDKVYYKKTLANHEVNLQGMEIIKNMSDEEFENIGSKSDTLHFNYLLGLASKKTTRKITKDEVRDCSTPIGVSLKTDIDIEIPRLKDVTKNKNTGINPSEDFEYELIQAGEVFNLTLYEFMYLIIRDEYGGILKVHNEEFYAHLSVKLPAFDRGEVKLPTPTINFQKGYGAARATMVDVDEKDLNNEWVIKSTYERFKPLINKRKRIRRK